MSERRTKTFLTRVRKRLTAREDVPASVRDAGSSVIDRADRLFDKLDGVADTLQRVAALELRLMERLVPIVDDLGEMVRHSLDEVRERRGLPPRARRSDDGPVIDHEPDPE